MRLVTLTAAAVLVLPFMILADIGPYNAQGEKAGEVDSHSAILMTRLTAAPVRDSLGYVSGAAGWVSFELSLYDDFSRASFTPWRDALVRNDFIVKVEVDGLSADTRWFYRAHIGTAPGRTVRVGERRSFRTAPEPLELSDVSAVITCCNVYNTLDHPEGYDSYAAMTRLRPDFVVTTGDNVYYDRDSPPGVDLESCRLHWQRMYSLPRLVEFFGGGLPVTG